MIDLLVQIERRLHRVVNDSKGQHCEHHSNSSADSARSSKSSEGNLGERIGKASLGTDVLNGREVSPCGRALSSAPTFFSQSFRLWYETRLLEDDLEAAKQAVRAARHADRQRCLLLRRRARGTTTPYIDVALGVHPELPSVPSRFGDESIQAFLTYMQKRESLRRRKEAGEPWPWSDDDTLNKYRFTNIKRENDRVTRWLRENFTKKHPNAEPALIVLNCALFRTFGTVAFAEEAGWISSVEDFKTPDIAIRAAASVWHRGLHAFTRAYCRPCFNSEKRDSHEPPVHVYSQACAKIVRLAEALDEAGDEIVSIMHSWRELASFIRNVKGYGGTGFVAKELILDIMGWSHIRALMRDDGNWTLPGPGARRGLNRLMHRNLNWGIFAPAESAVEEWFIDEMRLLHSHVLQLNLKSTFGPDCAAISIHDVQFVLCEYDKYARATSPGRRRSLAKYQPLEGTKFSTADGKPPANITCRPLRAEWNVIRVTATYRRTKQGKKPRAQSNAREPVSILVP